MSRITVRNLVPYENIGRNFKRYQSLLLAVLKKRNTKIGQDVIAAATNHQENSFTNRIQIETPTQSQKLKHIGHENNSPKKGNLINISSDQSSNV